MKRALLGFVLAGLLAPPAVLAQIGEPGVGGQAALVTYAAADPTGTCVIRTLWWNTTTDHLWFCDNGTWVDLVGAGAGNFPLLAPANDCAAPSYSWAGFTTAGLCNNSATTQRPRLKASDGTVTTFFELRPDEPESVWRMSDSGTGQTTHAVLTANSFDINNTLGSTSTTFNLRLNDATSGAFLSFVNIATPAKTITWSYNSAKPSLTRITTNGTQTITETVDIDDGAWSVGYADGAGSSTAQSQSGQELRWQSGPTGKTVGDMSLEGAYLHVTATAADQSAFVKPLVGGAATEFIRFGLSQTSYVGGTITYTVNADDATDYQALSGIITFSAVNPSGTEVCSLLDSPNVAAASAGTLMCTSTCVTGLTDQVGFALNCISSLTETTLNVRYHPHVSFTGAGDVLPQ